MGPIGSEWKNKAFEADERPLVLIGGGGHALVVGEAAELAGRRVRGFVDDRQDARVGAIGVAWLGPVSRAAEAAGEGAWILALGDLPVRRGVIERMGRRGAAVVVHPSAVISPTAEIGAGVFVGPRAVINARARIGAHAIINSGAIIEHECEIGENVHIAPGAVLGGNTAVGGGALVGIGARTIPGIRIGAGVVVGAGAVVIRDVPDGTRVVGSPARALR